MYSFPLNCCHIYFSSHGNLDRGFPASSPPFPPSGFCREKWATKESAGTASKFAVCPVVEGDEHFLGLAQCRMPCLALWKRRRMRYSAYQGGQRAATTHLSTAWYVMWWALHKVLQESGQESFRRDHACIVFENHPGVNLQKGGEARVGRHLSSIVNYFSYFNSKVWRGWNTKGKRIRGRN